MQWTRDRLRFRLAHRFGDAQDRREADLEVVRQVFRLAYNAYRPEPIDVPATMIRSEENPWLAVYSPEDWERLVPQVAGQGHSLQEDLGQDHR